MKSKSIILLAACAATLILIGLIVVSGSGDIWKKSLRNAELSKESVTRVRGYLAYMLDSIDASTGLFPAAPMQNSWRPRDTAADDYPYQVIASRYFGTEQDKELSLRLLKTEKDLSKTQFDLVDDFNITDRKILPFDADRAIFNTAEYAKDGLLPIIDATGKNTLWTERLVELIQSVFNAKEHWDSPVLPSTRLEVNGDMLQILVRLYWLTGDKKYLQSAENIAKHYLFEEPLIKPGSKISLKDHNNEVISGISEYYFALAHAEPEKRDIYRKPVHDLFDTIIQFGINNGLVLTTAAVPPTKAPAKAFSDNWGYVMNALWTVGKVDNDLTYKKTVASVLSSVSGLGKYEWEKERPYDGYADSIEGALSLFFISKDSKLETWIDDNMARLMKEEDAFIENTPNYLYGNIARTHMMYVFLKSEGLRLEPWPKSGGLGVVRKGSDFYVTILLPKGASWSGKLIPEEKRYESVWNMPEDYPRINALPERFTPESQKAYRVENLKTGDVSAYSGPDFAKGIALSATSTLRILISEGK